MKTSKIWMIVLIVIFVISQTSQAQNKAILSGKTKQTDYLKVIPYEEIAEKIIIHLQINGKTKRFIFDTGAAMNVITTDLFDELRPDKISSILTNDQSGRKEHLDVVNLGAINMGGIVFDDVSALVTTNNFIFNCFRIDGLIGCNMFRNSIIRISSKDKTITLTDNKSKIPLDKKQSTKLIHNSKYDCRPIFKATVQGNEKRKEYGRQPFFKLTVQNSKKLKDKVLFDSGAKVLYRTSLSNINLYAKHQIYETITEGHGNNSTGLFGTAKDTTMYRLKIPALNINDAATLQNVYAESTSSSRSRLGYRALNYGIVTIDFKNKRFYFEPFEEVYNIDEKRFAVSPTFKDGKYVVGIIWNQKLQEQINVGNQIMSINGIDYSAIELSKIVTKESPFDVENRLLVGIMDDAGLVKEIVLEKE